jgi:hypothetical protein
MDTLVIAGLFFSFLVWVWFAMTMNGILRQLKLLNKKAQNQVEFLNYISDSIDEILEEPEENKALG